jgi:hypothetical protein
VDETALSIEIGAGAALSAMASGAAVRDSRNRERIRVIEISFVVTRR